MTFLDVLLTVVAADASFIFINKNFTIGMKFIFNLALVIYYDTNTRKEIFRYRSHLTGRCSRRSKFTNHYHFIPQWSSKIEGKSLSYIAFVMSSCLFNGLPSTTVTGPSLMSAGYLKGGPKFMQKNSFQKRAATFVTKFAALFPYKYLGTGQVSS